MKQHYPSEYCPKCLNNRDPLEIDFENEWIGMLRKTAENYKCSKCDFTAPLRNMENSLGI